MYASFDRFEIKMTKQQALSVSHSGECIEDVKALINLPIIYRQLKNIDSNLIREELKEYGTWDEEELKDDVSNQERIIWIAGCNIIEELHYKKDGMK